MEPLLFNCPSEQTLLNCALVILVGECGMICTEALCGLINDMQTAQTEPILPALQLRLSTPPLEKRTVGAEAVSANAIQCDGQLPHRCSPAV